MYDLHGNILNEAGGNVPFVDIEIREVLEKFGLKYMSADTDIVSIKVTDAEGKFDVTRVNKVGKEITQRVKKFGGLLTELFPGLDVVGDPTIQKMINELRTVSNKIVLREDFEIHDDITKWYRELKKIDKHVFHSCITGREQLLEPIENEPNIQIVIMNDKKTGKPKGRALLFHKVQDADTKEVNSYLERCYPNNDEYVKNEYIKWAKLEGFWYRTYQGARTEDISKISGKEMKLRFMFEKPIEEIPYLPYMDTFRNLWVFNGKNRNYIIATNYKTKSAQWWSDNERGSDLSKPGKIAQDFRVVNNWVDDRRAPDPPQPRRDDAVFLGDCRWCERSIYDDMNYYNIAYDGNDRLMCGNCYDDYGFHCDSCDEYLSRDDAVTVNPNTGNSMLKCYTCADNANDIKKCRWCSNFYTINNLHTTDNDHLVCDYCATRRRRRGNVHVEKCKDCNKYIEVDRNKPVKEAGIRLLTSKKNGNQYSYCDDCMINNHQPDEFYEFNEDTVNNYKKGKKPDRDLNDW